MTLSLKSPPSQIVFALPGMLQFQFLSSITPCGLRSGLATKPNGWSFRHCLLTIVSWSPLTHCTYPTVPPPICSCRVSPCLLLAPRAALGSSGVASRCYVQAQQVSSTLLRRRKYEKTLSAREVEEGKKCSCTASCLNKKALSMPEITRGHCSDPPR